MAIPDEQPLIAAIKAIREEEPGLARAKVLKRLKEENNWELSDKRLKVCMNENHLNTARVVAEPVALKARDEAYDRLVKEFFGEFTKLEREFLLALSPADCKALMPGAELDTQEQRLHIVCHLRHYIELFLTLKGIRSCTAIYHQHGTGIFTRLVNEILKPLIQKYKLKSYGFALRQITQATMIHQGNPTPDKWWEGGWIFADTTSSLWTQVESVLLPAKKMVITPETRFEYENELGKIFGYPVAEYPMEAMINKEVQTVTYIDATEQKVLSNLFVYPVCCVIAFEFWDEIGTQENWNGIMEHFVKCAKAVEEAGGNLKIDPSGHDGLDYHLEFLRQGKAILQDMMVR